jgi:4-diphosphocytidyl-2C-methyl-D-erythritol kinase
MSGSGSAVFGLFDSAARAEECFAGLKMTFPEVFLCRTADFGCAITR